MAAVWIPPLMRDLTDGREKVNVPGKTVGEVIQALEEACPGVKKRLFEGGRLDPTIKVSVDGKVARRGLLEVIEKQSEIRFLSVVAGG